MSEITVTVRCVACGATRKIRPSEVPLGDVPMCAACFSPMASVAAESRTSGPPADRLDERANAHPEQS